MSKYRFIKNSNLDRPRNISKEQYASASYGDVFEYEPQDVPLKLYGFYGVVTGSNDYKLLRSLKNTINYYKATDELFDFDNFYNKPTSLLSFSSAHLGSGIQKGTVSLSIYLSGSKIANCTDFRENGVLYDTSDQKIGIVLYNEGFILLNNTSSVSSEQSSFDNRYESLTDDIRWTYYCSTADEAILYDIDYSTKNEVPTNTYFVIAEKNQLNHSNNFTYIKSGSYHAQFDSLYQSYIEDTDIEVKKTNKSPFVSGSANFEKQTFITNIGLYDKDKNLIAVGSLANPVKKTENREFLFKLRVDF